MHLCSFLRKSLARELCTESKISYQVVGIVCESIINAPLPALGQIGGEGLPLGSPPGGSPPMSAGAPPPELGVHTSTWGSPHFLFLTSLTFLFCLPIADVEIDRGCRKMQRRTNRASLPTCALCWSVVVRDVVLHQIVWKFCPCQCTLLYVP